MIAALSPRQNRYRDTLQRFSAWLYRHRNSDGSLRAPNLSSIPYMALPVYGHATGQTEVTVQALRMLETHYVHGGVLEQPERLSQMKPYAPAWIVMGAALGENLRLRDSVRADVLSFQDRRTGGFFGSLAARDAERGVIDFDSTTQACGALCCAGQEEAAVRCGQFLKKFLEAQPDSSRLYLQWDSEKGLIQDFAPETAQNHLLVYNAPRQRLYKIGLLARALGLLHGLTGEKAYLDLAQSEYAKAADRSPDIWQNALSHKMGWAAWTLFPLTGNRRYVEDACRMADHLVTLQQPDGGFNYPELWKSYADTPLDTKAGGAQFATWIAYAGAIDR